MAGPNRIEWYSELGMTKYFYPDGTVETRYQDGRVHFDHAKGIKVKDMSAKKVGGYELPAIGQKVVHTNGIYRASVVDHANVKYNDPSTLDIIFRGDDGELYTRPLNSFWQYWRKVEPKYVVYTTYIDGCLSFMERDVSNRIRWTRNRMSATRFSKAQAEERINVLRDVGAPGTYNFQLFD